jgi:hypothetical protein
MNKGITRCLNFDIIKVLKESFSENVYPPTQKNIVRKNGVKNFSLTGSG